MSKTYSKLQAAKLKTHTFATTTQSGASIVKAYLKENAAKRLGVSVEAVYAYNGFTNGVSVDELVPTYDHVGVESFEIRMRND